MNFRRSGEWLQDPGSILASFVIGEIRGPELLENIKQERAVQRSSTEVSQAPSHSNISPKTNIEQEGRRHAGVDETL